MSKETWAVNAREALRTDLLENLEKSFQAEELRVWNVTINFVLRCDHALLAASSVFRNLGQLFVVMKNHKPVEGDVNEHSVMTLYGRAYNTTSAALQLFLSGYLQPSIAMHRELFEIDTHLSYFTYVPDAVARWANVRPAERTPEEFKPWKLRESVDKFEKDEAHHVPGKRGKSYADLSFISHPNLQAMQLLLSDSKTMTLVPFPQLKHVDVFFENLAILTYGIASTLDKLLLSLEPELRAKLEELRKASQQYFEGMNG